MGSSWSLGCFDTSSYFRVAEIPKVDVSEVLAIAIRQIVGKAGSRARMKTNNDYLIDEFYDELVMLYPGSFGIGSQLWQLEERTADDGGDSYLNQRILPSKFPRADV
jgi:hypothetical protein